MKKIIVGIMVAMMVMLMVGCGEEHTRTTTVTQDSYGNSYTTYTVDGVEVTKEMYDEWRVPAEDEKVVDGKLAKRVIPQDVITEDTILDHVLGK